MIREKNFPLLHLIVSCPRKTNKWLYKKKNSRYREDFFLPLLFAFPKLRCILDATGLVSP